jgi:hypothetical protein
MPPCILLIPVCDDRRRRASSRHSLPRRHSLFFLYVAVHCTGMTLSAARYGPRQGHAWLSNEYVQYVIKLGGLCRIQFSARRRHARTVSILCSCGRAARRWRLGRVPHRRNRPAPTTEAASVLLRSSRLSGAKLGPTHVLFVLASGIDMST